MKTAIHWFVATFFLFEAVAFAGGNIVEPVEPNVVVPPKEVVMDMDEDVKYDGWYGGISYSLMSMNEAVLTTGHAASFVAGYYFNKYFGVEMRYSTTLGKLAIDQGATTIKSNESMSNIALYAKPIYNVTPGLAVYGLFGYGKSTYEKGGVQYSNEGTQYGLGAKYELANGIGFFVDYIDLHDDDIYNGRYLAQDLLFDMISVGTTYTFY